MPVKALLPSSINLWEKLVPILLIQTSLSAFVLACPLGRNILLSDFTLNFIIIRRSVLEEKKRSQTRLKTVQNSRDLFMLKKAFMSGRAIFESLCLKIVKNLRINFLV